MAKTEQYTAQQMIDALIATKGMTTIAAKRLGCSYNTVMRYIRKYPTVADALKEAREGMLDFAELKLFDQMNEGNTTALIFFLKTQGKQRGYIERQEMTGANGNPIVYEFVYPDEDES